MSMNIFRLAGDMCHILSIIVLLYRLRVAKNAQGISLRTHELFLLVFVTRYLDLFTYFYSVYNSVMKVLFIASTASIIYTIRFEEPIKSTYDKGQDSFSHWNFAVAPCAVIAFITHVLGGHNAFDHVIRLLWTFSIYLESIAILPQLIVLQRYGEIENLTGNYIFLMGAYRAFYILNWIYRANVEPNYKHHWVVYFCGVLQTLLYADFFYYYIQSKKNDGNDIEDVDVSGNRDAYDEEYELMSMSQRLVEGLNDTNDDNANNETLNQLKAHMPTLQIAECSSERNNQNERNVESATPGTARFV